jgi:hypothetical protein
MSGASPLAFGSPLVDTFNWAAVGRAAANAAQIRTPVQQQSARGGADPLDSPQRAVVLGESIPIVFGRRIGDAGGVLISPAATEARFTNNLANDVTVSYRLVLSEGVVDPIQVRDVFQQSCRVGSFTQAYNRPAGAWTPGNFLVKRGSKPLPEATIYCGTGTGSYQGLTVGSFVNTIPDGFDQYNRQVHVFVRGGVHVERLISGTVGPSNNIADLVLYLLRRTSRVPDSLVDFDSMRGAALFTKTNRLSCNIELRQPTNLADWLADTLPYFLLRETRRNGKRGLRPVLPSNSDGSINTNPVDWAFQFTDDHVFPQSFQISYIERAQRKPFTAAIIWRQQPPDALGLARSTEVRYPNANPDDPVEQHDLSAFATNERHAVKVGAYIASRRRHISHQVTVAIRPGPYLGSLAPGDVVRLTLEREEANGAIRIHDFLYEIDRIASTPDGQTTLELTHFPIDANGRSLVALDVEAARGRGDLLPTGRAAVNCDDNDPDDESVTEDDGPPDDWEPPEPSPPIYGDREDENWEYDEENDRWIYIGPERDDWEWDVEEQRWKLKDPDWEWDEENERWKYVGPERDGWEWDEELQEWVPSDDSEDDWEWDPVDDLWDYVGPTDPDWNWNREDQKWEYIGDPVDNWQWNEDRAKWEWQGDDFPSPEPDGPPSFPPGFTEGISIEIEVSLEAGEADDASTRVDGVEFTIDVSLEAGEADDTTTRVNGAELEISLSLESGAATAGPPAGPPETPPEEKPFDPPAPIDEVPESEPEDEWGDGPTEPLEPEIPDQAEYTATVSIGTPIVRYPDVFYLVTQANFAQVTVEVTVDNAPRFTDLRVLLSNNGTPVSVVIPVGQTRGIATMNGSAASLTGCTTRTIGIQSYEGGGYTFNGLDTAATQTYQVCGYVGTVSFEAAVWTREDDEWVFDGDTPEGWSWSGSSAAWSWTGNAVPNWSWNVGTQNWAYTGEGAATGRPALPPPVPDSLPPDGEAFTVVARAAVNVPPVPNEANDLVVEVVADGDEVGEITIAAVDPVVDGWRYNFATQQWDKPSAWLNPWQWSPAGGDWVYLRQIPPGYTYNASTNTWSWSGTGPQPSAPPIAPDDEPPSVAPFADWENTRASVGELTYHV